MNNINMQKFIITTAGHKLTAREIEEAIYNTFTEMGRDEVIVSETI